MLTKITRVSLLIFFVLGAGYVWSSSGVTPRSGSLYQERQETSEKKVRLSTEQLARAKTLFDGKCARCHGADGRGESVLGEMLGVPAFTDRRWWKDRGDDDDLLEAITKGSGEMPAFGKKLTKQEISLLANYVRHFNKPEH